MKIVDTHAHFWDVNKIDYPWIDKESYFHRTFSLEDYKRASSNVSIEKMIFVECDAYKNCSMKEVQLAEEFAETDHRIQGIVARVQLIENENLHADLDAMAARPLVKGIRHNIQGNPIGFASQQSFIQGVKEVHLRGLHFELCLTHTQLEETIALVRQCPEVRFVLNHCAKPGIRAGEKEPWLSQMHRLADHANVMCKVSGLLTEADWEHWAADEVLWYAQNAAEAFGSSRIMFGSDWPVSEVAGGYQKWYELTLLLASSWNELDKEKFYSKNAIDFYRL